MNRIFTFIDNNFKVHLVKMHPKFDYPDLKSLERHQKYLKICPL